MEIGNKRSSQFVADLLASGVIPHDCVSFQLDIRPNEIIKIYATVYATKEQLSDIKSALDRAPWLARDVAREIVFKEPISGEEVKVDL